jgi:16S rRNA (guanine527-N7)-methyltransferase
MDLRRIATLLKPFLAGPIAKGLSFRGGFVAGEPAVLSKNQLQQISTYLDLLLRWNARINLTSVRDPDAIVSRHFGESLFAARYLFPFADSGSGRPLSPVQSGSVSSVSQHPRLLDFGSGAGFPGLPIKIWAPDIDLTLIESNLKKATFLREVIRRLSLDSAGVFAGRGEDFPGEAEIVTLRAVERFESSVPVAAHLPSHQGRLALLIGEAQVDRARRIEPNLRWQDPIPIPLSSHRVLLIGFKSPVKQESK